MGKCFQQSKVIGIFHPLSMDRMFGIQTPFPTPTKGKIHDLSSNSNWPNDWRHVVIDDSNLTAEPMVR